MTAFYSASTRGFYFDDFHGAAIPDDKVMLADEEYQALLLGQAAGKFIVPSDEGLPLLVDVPPESMESTRTRILSERDALLAQAAIRMGPLQDAVEVGLATPEDVALLDSWKRYRVALHRLEHLDGFPHELVWPESPV